MTRLQQLCHTRTNAPVQTNVVIVPGHNGENLAQRTCPHFPAWLDHLVDSRQNNTVVWLFCHELQVDSLSSWYAYCEAGETLLQDLTRLQEDENLSEDATLILIGHKLGCFVLKKALREAHQASNRPNIYALLGTIDTLVMLGDPYLDPEHESEWIPLIRKCLPCKTLPERLSISQDARCLERIAFHFEEFTLTSTLFQVSGTIEPKRKHTLKLRRHTEDPRCICSANMTVRMWTTSAEQITVSPGAGNIKDCAFHAESAQFKNLVSIPDYTRLSIASSRPLSQVQDAQEADTESPSSLTIRKEPEPAKRLAASRQTAPVTLRAASIDDTAPSSNSTSTQGSENQTITCDGGGLNMSALRHGSLPIPSNPEQATSSAAVSTPSVLENNAKLRGDAFSPTEALANVSVLAEGEHLQANDMQEAIVSGEDCQTERIEDSHIRCLDVQHYSLEVSVTYERPCTVRRSPLLTTRVPHRDAKFFGREVVLALMMDLLRPASTPSDGRLLSLDSGTLVILYGVAGVGKSAVALEVMYRIQGQYDHVLWLRADSELHLARAFHEAAIGLQLVQNRGDYNHESSRLKLLQWLSTTEATWLLVFDDADEPEILPRYMPKSHRGSIITTSRRLHPDEFSILNHPGLCTIKVHPFGFEEAVAFLRTFALEAGDIVFCEAKLAATAVIGRQYRYLPLILRRLGIMIGRRSLPEDALVKAILEEHARGELLSQPGSPLVYGYLSPASDALASVLTCLDPHQIDDAILLGAQRCTGFPLKYFPMTDHDYFDAKNELSLHALLQPSVDHFAVHRVTHATLRNNLNLVQFGQSLHCASQLLEGRWPSRRKMRNVVLGNWPEFDSLHSHIHELASTYVSYVERLEDVVYEQQDFLNDSLLRVLLLSTWYNARRGNAEEDRPLVRLLHGLIANLSRQKTGLGLDGESPAAPLPLRLIDIGDVPGESPRLVNTAGETGCYVALSHAWSDKQITKLTRSNMESLQEGIDTSDRQEWQAAIKLTRMLGMRYLWIDSLCILQDDEEEKIETILKMQDIYRFSVATICYAIADVGDVFLHQSFSQSTLSISLNRTPPEHASAVDKTFQTSSVWSSRLWTSEELILSPLQMHLRDRVWDHINGGLGIKAFVEQVPLQAALDLSQSLIRWLLEKGTEAQISDCLEGSTDVHSTHISSNESEVAYVQTATQTRIEDQGTKCHEAGLMIDEGAQYAGANKVFEALASLMTAKDLVSLIRPYDVAAEEIHLKASAGICMVYLMQNLPTLGLGIAQSALASHMGSAESPSTLASGLYRIHFAIGSIENALGHPDEGLKSYENARNHLLDEESETPEWKAVLNLKIAEALIARKDYKAAHNLLTQSLEHFQSQDTIPAQAHLARTLHRQAITYEAEGSKAMGKAIQAAARATWIGVREARKRSVSGDDVGSALTARDFDAEVEFWYR